MRLAGPPDARAPASSWAQFRNWRIGAVENPKAPGSLCYVYDAQGNALTLERVEPIRKLDVKVNSAKGGTLTEKTYDELLQADFRHIERRENAFTILLGTQDPVQGVPVQICCQPNRWFQVVSNPPPKTWPRNEEVWWRARRQGQSPPGPGAK
jgi:hypothetical protein